MPEEHRRVRFFHVAERLGKRKKDFTALQNEWCSTYRAIMTLVAPNLEVLSFFLETCGFSFAPPGVQFPLLRELSTSGYGLPMPGIIDLPHLPVLRRLHIHHGYCGYLSRLVSHLSITQNDLECLRLSGMSQVPDLANVLAVCIGSDEYTKRMRDRGIAIDIPQTRTFSRLHTLILEPGEIPAGGRCGTGRLVNLQMIYNLQELGEISDGPTKVSVLPARRTNYSADEARRDWRYVVQRGGRGAWSDEVHPERLSVPKNPLWRR
jgi:hypothetical protein